MKKGISLVALVITIIVLIILTAAVILTVSNDGILDKAQYAADEKSKLEVYSAVQREVLNVQNEKRELVFGIDFANELKIRLDKKHPASDSIVEYNPSTKEIDIIFTANNKKYNLCLDNKYRLTMLTKEEIANKSIIEERKLIQSHVDGVESITDGELLREKLPEGWEISTFTYENILRQYTIYSESGNTFYYDSLNHKVVGEQIGKEKFDWSYDGKIARYWGNEEEIDLTKLTVLSNVYNEVKVSDQIIRYEKGNDLNVSDVINFSFERNKQIVNVILPNNLTSIVDKAFNYCIELTSVTLPENLQIIGDFSFGVCSALPNITLPNTLTAIGKHAFVSCYELTDISIPNNVTTIGEYAFYNCTGLTKIKLSNKLNTINTSLFYGCKNLTTIEIPSSVTKIESFAFRDCTALTDITIPSSVTNIETGVFNNCTSLSTIKVGSDAVKELVEASGFAGTVDVID